MGDRMRKKLVGIGLPMAIIGCLCTVVCFVLFVTAGDASVTSNGFSTRALVPFILFIPSFIVGAAGVIMSLVGLKGMPDDTATKEKAADENIAEEESLKTAKKDL